MVLWFTHHKQYTLVFWLRSFFQCIWSADFIYSQVVSCEVVKKTKEGIDVELVQSGKLGFIPKLHLSDSIDLSNSLWENLKPGDVIEKAMYFNKMKIAVSFQKLKLTFIT